MKKYSKFLSYVLRHRPDVLDIELDDAGWTDIDPLLEALVAKDNDWDLELLHYVVEHNNKKRFEIEDGRIRARQGHSVKVDLGYVASEPPAVLYHGTVARVLDAIFSSGLLKMNRHHVHLSADVETATNVGGRLGKPVILEVDAAAMFISGSEFFVTDNGVWLVEHVPPEYLSHAEDS